MKTGIQRAAEAVGTQAKLAEKLGVSRQRVWYWVKCGYVPPEWAKRVEAASLVPAADLCPQVFGDLKRA